MRIKTAGLAALLILPAMPGAALAQDTAAPAAEAPPPATRAESNRVTIRTARRADHSRIALDFPGAIPAYALTRTASGYEVRFRGRQPFDLGGFRAVADVAGISVARDGGDSILRLALTCPCEVQAVAEQRTLRFLVRRTATPAEAPEAMAAPAPAPVAAAAAPSPVAAAAAPPPVAATAAPPPVAATAAPSPVAAPAAAPPVAAPAAAPSPVAGAAPAAPPAVDRTQIVTPRTARRPDHVRLAFDFQRAVPSYDMRNSGNQYEIRLRGGYQLDMSQFRALSEVSGLAATTEGSDSVIRFALDCNCAITRETSPRTLHLLLKRLPGRPPEAQARATPVAVRTAADTLRATSQAAAAASPEAPQAASPAPAPAAAPANGGPGAPQTRRGRQAQVAQAAPAPAEVDRLRESITRQLGIMNGTITAPAPAAPAPGAPTGAQAPRQDQAGQARAAGSPAPDAAASAPMAPAALAASTQAARDAAQRQAGHAPRPVPPRPTCAPDFDPGRWGGATAGAGHAERMTTLRTALAASGEAPEDAANLAEYLVGQGLLPEALDLLRDRINGDLDAATRLRLQRARDVARLLRRSPIDPNSPLLAERPDCDREDLALWQALAASASGDSAAVVALLPKAQRGLRAAPDRLRMAYAFALADGIGDNVDALRSLAAPIRTAVPGTESEEAGRNLLLARIAGLAGARDEERLYLRRAAAATRTIPGLFAAARLAARDAERAGPANPEAQRAEARLVEIARTYRHDALGEEASILYAQLLLARDNLPGALLAADAASSASTRPFLDSRGAALAARILRLLLVDAEGRPLPPAEERLSMFWGFEGYATPGERGDDIRLGAARLMLERDLPDAALDVVRELAPATAQSPRGALLVARVEAAAPEGDPQKALAILRSQDLGEDGRRAAAQALARMNRPSDAANELSPLRDRKDLGNRGRYLFLAQRWTDAANVYAEVLRDPTLDAAQRTEATGRYATAAALSQRPVNRVPNELLSPADSGTRSLLLLQAHEPPQRSTQQGARIELILNAIDRAKRIEAMAPATTEAR